jgi:hypothetical protein
MFYALKFRTMFVDAGARLNQRILAKTIRAVISGTGAY